MFKNSDLFLVLLPLLVAEEQQGWNICFSIPQSFNSLSREPPRIDRSLPTPPPRRPRYAMLWLPCSLYFYFSFTLSLSFSEEKRGRGEGGNKISFTFLPRRTPLFVVPGFRLASHNFALRLLRLLRLRPPRLRGSFLPTVLLTRFSFASVHPGVRPTQKGSRQLHVLHAVLLPMPPQIWIRLVFS